MDGYAVTIAPGGPKITPAPPDKEQDDHSARIFDIRTTGLTMTLPTFAIVLGSHLGMPVEDRTGLTGPYFFHFDLTEEMINELHRAAISMRSPSRPMASAPASVC